MSHTPRARALSSVVCTNGKWRARRARTSHATEARARRHQQVGAGGDQGAWQGERAGSKAPPGGGGRLELVKGVRLMVLSITRAPIILVRGCWCQAPWARLSSASRITSATSAWLVGLSPARTDPHAKMFGLIAERYGRLRGAGPRDPAGVSGRIKLADKESHLSRTHN